MKATTLTLNYDQPSLDKEAWCLRGDLTAQECKQLAIVLGLEPEKPSEGHTESQSWSRNREEILIELGYGITYSAELHAEVCRAAEGLNHNIEIN